MLDVLLEVLVVSLTVCYVASLWAYVRLKQIRETRKELIPMLKKILSEMEK